MLIHGAACCLQLMVGSFKAMIAELSRNPLAVAVNCAGLKLHEFLPLTKAPADDLRSAGRLIDLEWEDRPNFNIPRADLFAAIQWVHEKIQLGDCVVINCAQGKSRSGTLAVAYLMAPDSSSMEDALCFVQSKRPFVSPNAGFLKQLRSLQPELCMLFHNSLER
mmetsp:Transcript_9072/g.19792  ORF Transcript_9072/g.19792 Transcript_9072/m.19792 type:complete len:164 (+) Transcript_9072:371-862(+)